MYSKTMIVGRLGNDPELRYTQNQTAVTSLSIATTESYKDDSGERKDITTWHRVNVWGKMAENCSKYLTKGKLALVEGVYRSSKYTDKQGIERTSMEIRADVVRFLSPRDQEGQPHQTAADAQPEGAPWP